MRGTAGRPYRAIPGPSVVPDRVLQAMHRPAPDIYGGELHDLVASLFPDLRRVAGTAQHVAIYIGNGHAMWEAAIANLFSPGDRVLSFVTGHFGHGWAQIARAMGVEVETVDCGRRSAGDLDRLEAALRADRAHRLRAVLVTHVDTASTARTDIAAIRRVLDAAGHPALLMVDAIASVGCDPMHMDAWGVDVLVGASQKGLMTPPGLGVLWFSERARAAGKGARLRTPYWDWEPRVAGAEFYQLFSGTAPTHHLYGLRTALDMLVLEEGLEEAWARHARLAATVWAAVDAWGLAGSMALNIADPAMRACGVTAVRMEAPHATRLREWCDSVAGVTLGIGLGMAARDDPQWHGYFRIAHMGHVNAHMTLGVLAAMDAGLKALGVAHGHGAVEAAAATLAEAATDAVVTGLPDQAAQ